MEGHGFPKTSGGLRSTAMVRLAERARQLWDQITTRESAYQPYQEEVEEEEQRKKDKRDPVLPQYQGGKKSPKKGEVVNSRVEAALSDSRTFVITLSCRLSEVFGWIVAWHLNFAIFIVDHKFHSNCTHSWNTAAK